MAQLTDTDAPDFIVNTRSPEWKAELAKAFQPVVMAFLLSAAVFYVIVSALHLFVDAPAALPVLGIYALGISLSSAYLFSRLRRGPATLPQLEISSLVPIAMILALIVTHQLLVFDPTRLIHFVMLIMVIVTAGVSLRLIVPAVAATLLASGSVALMGGTTGFFKYMLVAFAGTFVAFGVVAVMRAAVKQQIHARLKFDHLRRAAEHCAGHDQLTGLPNRRHFFSAIEKVAKAAERGPSHLTLGIMDLNGFKSVNDIHGHGCGDELLLCVAQRITICCGPGMLVARLGGDEFAILIKERITPHDLRELGSRICKAVGTKYRIAGAEINVSASVGFAQTRGKRQLTSQLYEQADFALYRAKTQHGGGVKLFSHKEEAELLDLRKVEHQLLNCDRESELFMLFQPQIDMVTGKTFGFEALARWRNPELGLVPPAVFIRAAERTGLITALTPILLKKALAAATNWPDPIRLSFNLSAKDICSPEACRNLCKIIRASDFPAERIEFEITGTSIMTDINRVRASLAFLTSTGAKIAIHDFGIGYANFVHIDELDVNTIKLDRTFTAKLGTGENTGKIVKTIIDMCANLGAKCIVEGIETANELKAVEKLGARYIQGFYFSGPIDAGEIPEFLSGGERSAQPA